MWRIPAVATLALWLISLLQPVLAQNGVFDIPLASGGSQRVLFAGPANPRATLVMLPGGSGVIGIEAGVNPTSNNFLVRTQALWVAQGFAVAILGAPDGRPLLGLRHTPYYAAAIDRAVDFARSRANAPVWLIGTSQGSTAAVNGAAHLGGKVAGLVLTSSVTQRSRSGETVFESEPGLIAAPVLVVANQGDACRATPPADAALIVGALSRAARTEVIVVTSSASQEGPCDALSPHGFLGIEAQVIQRISDWIRANPGR